MCSYDVSLGSEFCIPLKSNSAQVGMILPMCYYLNGFHFLISDPGFSLPLKWNRAQVFLLLPILGMIILCMSNSVQVEHFFTNILCVQKLLSPFIIPGLNNISVKSFNTFTCLLWWLIAKRGLASPYPFTPGLTSAQGLTPAWGM